MNRKSRILAALAFAAAAFPAQSFAQDSNALLVPPVGYPAGVNSNGIQPMAPAAAAADPDAAFKEALKQIVPLSDEQVLRLRRELDKIDQAQGKPLTSMQSSTRSVRISLKSGERPSVINTRPGWISTLTFSDVTGAPWPVLSVTNGNPDAYNIQSSGQEGATNIITISSKQGYVASNIAVTLVGAKVPIMLELQPSAGAVDFRVDAMLDDRGPNASMDVISSDNLPPTSDAVMIKFLDGVPPEGAKPLTVKNSDVQAWRYNDMTYIRTNKVAMSPAYISKQSNASGTNVFVLPEAPVVLFSDRGTGRQEFINIGR